MGLFGPDAEVREVLHCLAIGQAYDRSVVFNLVWSATFSPYVRTSQRTEPDQISKRKGHVDRQIGRLVRVGLLKELPDGRLQRTAEPDRDGEMVGFMFRGIAHRCPRRDYASTVAALKAQTPEAIQAATIDRLQKQVEDLQKEIHHV